MSVESISAQHAELITRARDARGRAYAPYSKYAVGAAVLADGGAIFCGCNVENATYGATLCAERVAVVAMVASGAKRLVAVAVFTDGDPLGMPCGICRQVLFEFADENAVVLAASPRETKVMTLGALFPAPFVLRP